MTVTSVRRAGVQDAAAIALVNVRSWQAAYRGLVSDSVLDALSVEEREVRWRERLERDEGTSFTLVAEHDAAVAGFCTVSVPSGDDDAGELTAEVGAIYVEPDLRREGLGSTLLTAALDRLRADGWREATLWVFAENDVAREFYGRFGFAPDRAEKTHERTGQTVVRLRASLAD
jgi:ribosomal protein S18 acetylase RimI-like enzyme